MVEIVELYESDCRKWKLEAANDMTVAMNSHKRDSRIIGQRRPNNRAETAE